LQAGQAIGDEALPPAADGVTVAAQLVCDLVIGRLIGVRGPQD